MIVFQGISPIAAGGAALGCAILLTALHFLHFHTPGVEIPSVMLWLDDDVRKVRRILRGRLSQLPSLILPLIAAAATAAALAEPVWSFGDPPPRLVIVAGQDALDDAEKLLDRADPLRSALVAAAGGGVILRDFGAPALPVLWPENAALPEADAIAALAELKAGTSGIVCWIGGDPAAPWLPENSAAIPGGAKKVSGRGVRPDAAVFVSGNSAQLRDALRGVPGIKIVDVPESADLCFTLESKTDASDAELEAAASRLLDAVRRSGLVPEENRQTAAVGTQDFEPPRRSSLRLAGILFAVAVAAALGDVWLWFRHKAV